MTTSRVENYGEVDKDHRTQTSVEDDAKKVLEQINEVRPSGHSSAPTFREQARRWLSQCESRQRDPIKPATIRGWRSYLNVHILPTIQNTPLSDVNNLAVKNFVIGLAAKVKPKTIKDIVQVIKMVRASAFDEQGEERYPIKWNHTFIDMPKIVIREQNRPSFSKDEIEKMIDAGDRQMQMLTILFAATGLRVGEMFGLEIKHFDGRSIKVEQAAWDGLIQIPKTENAHRMVELYPRVAKLLKSYIGSRKQGFIFPNDCGKVIHQSNFLRREFHPGIPRRRYHGFRRYRNTFLRNEAGCPDGLLKYWLGHSRERNMSDRYDMVRDNAAIRLKHTKRMGVGFNSLRN